MATLKPRNRPSTPAKHPFDLPEGLPRQLARAQANMAAPFKGITTAGHVRPGLYALRQTGISVQPIIDAAESDHLLRRMIPRNIGHCRRRC
jgi:hypothetical protein